MATTTYETTTPSGYGALDPEYFPAADKRWRTAMILVGSFLVAGVIFSFGASRALSSYSFSARVSFIYLPCAIVTILVTGARFFPIALAVFMGFLPLAQSTSATLWFLGEERGAITVEMLLAVPLLATVFFGPDRYGYATQKSLPKMLKVSLALILVTSLFSTMFALSFNVAFWGYLGRFFFPILILIVGIRRLQSVADFRVVWTGFAIGYAATAVFSFRRAVLGVGGYGISQRYLGMTTSAAITAIFLVGGALWLARERIVNRGFLKAIVWFVFVGALISLAWLSGGRVALFGLLVLVALWTPGQIVRSMMNPKVLLFSSIVLVVGGGIAVYSVSKTTLDVELIFERFRELLEHGIKGEGRWFIWKEGMNYWSSRPILGIGPNNWIIKNSHFMSVHGSFVGIFIDVGLLGVVVFGFFFYSCFAMSFKASKWFASEDRQFFLGCRNSWIIMVLLMMVSLPFTSGQITNNLLSYLVFFYPMLLTSAYKQRQGDVELFYQQQGIG